LSILVEVDAASWSSLGLPQLDNPPIAIVGVGLVLRPVNGVLLAEAHPGVHRDHELGQVLREELSDCSVETRIFVLSAEVPNAGVFLAIRSLAAGLRSTLSFSSPIL
jgi:hypothetical protein